MVDLEQISDGGTDFLCERLYSQLELQRVGEIVVAMTCAAGEAYGEKSWLIVDVR